MLPKLLVLAVLTTTTTTTVRAQFDDYFGVNDELSFEEQIVKSEIEIAGLELRDECENGANAQRSSLIANTFATKLKVREAHGQLSKRLAKDLRKFENDISLNLERNWTLFVHPGDALLEDDDWRTLVSYDLGVDEFIHTETVHCHNETDSCIFIKSGYEKLFRTCKNETTLKKAWAAYQTLLLLKKNHFPHILSLVNKAATQNEQEDAKSYWQMLTELDGAYSLVDDLWDNMKPLYFKLQQFVRKQIFHFYNIKDGNSDIPVYLLGSNFGNDWSHVAGIVLPYPQPYYKAENYVKKRSVEDVFKMSEETTEKLSLGSLGSKFWSNSLFNMSFCENNIVSYCVEEYSELLTCGESSWVTYLDAYEVAVDVTLRNLNYVSLSQMNLRFSVLNEALKALASVLAIQNLKHEGILESDLSQSNDTSANEMMETLLIALRLLPKLPYYLAADKWRLYLLENGFDDFERKWWEFRKEYQGVEGVTNTETDFIGDSHMTSNTPYLSKLLGTILMFQIWEYYDFDNNFPETLAKDENFLTMLYRRPSTDWSSLLSNYYGIYRLSADAMLNYFSRLSDYLDGVAVGQVIVSTTESPTTIAQHKPDNVTQPKLEPLIKLQTEDSEDDEGPNFPPEHKHVEEHLEGPNRVMEEISMYVGLALLALVAAVSLYAIVLKKIRDKRENNNRRFET